MQNYHLEKPKISKADRLAVIQALEDPAMHQQLNAFIKQANEPDYRYWDTLKYKKPIPAKLAPLQAWFAVKLQRILERQPSIIRTEDGHAFGWTKLSSFECYCHEFDLHTGGELLTSVGELKTDEKKRLISKGLMDEAIASAQLEGADTGRVYAKKMLRERIRPRNASDQMILNNHRAMLAIEARFKDQPLSLDLIVEMHSMLTEKTVDSEGGIPQLREDNAPMYVLDNMEGFIYHTAPSMNFVQQEIERFVHFANNDDEEFIHPIVKACIIHFWIGYLHPFTDGNGRLARLLFYWYLLRHDYWAFAYLPIAVKIKSGGKKNYMMSYVYAEQDDYDLTYFINYLLRKTVDAHKDFQSYLAETRKSNSGIAFIARSKYNLNDRQIQLIKYLAADHDNFTTISSYISVSGVSRATTINDLNDLRKKAFISKRKIGRTVYFYGTELINNLSKQSSI